MRKTDKGALHVVGITVIAVVGIAVFMLSNWLRDVKEMANRLNALEHKVELMESQSRLLQGK